MLSNFRFHHIGVAVKSIDKTATIYEQGGYCRSKITLDPIQNVNICWLLKDGMPMVELLEPIDDSSPVCKTLEKNGVTPYHTCYIVDNIDKAIIELRKQRYVQVSQPVEAVAISGSMVCFMFNKNVGLIELVESPAIITK